MEGWKWNIFHFNSVLLACKWHFVKQTKLSGPLTVTNNNDEKINHDACPWHSRYMSTWTYSNQSFLTASRHWTPFPRTLFHQPQHHQRVCFLLVTSLCLTSLHFLSLAHNFGYFRALLHLYFASFGPERGQNIVHCFIFVSWFLSTSECLLW